MAYAAFSVVFGEQPSAAKWNILGTNDASFNDGTGIANMAISTTSISNPYKFAAENAVNQTGVPSGGSTALTLGTEIFDTNNNFTGGTYTAPVTGFYYLSGSISMAGSAGLILGAAGCDIFKNGTTSILNTISSYDNNTSYDNINANVSGLVSLTAGDTIVLRGVVTVSAGTVTFSAGSSCRFSGCLISQT